MTVLTEKKQIAGLQMRRDRNETTKEAGIDREKADCGSRS